MLCLDSDFLIDVARGRPAAVALVKAFEADGETPAASAVTVYEVTDTAHAEQRAALVDLVGTLEILPVDGSVAIAASALAQHLARKGQATPPADLLIAATCLLHGATLVTRNRRHFARIPHLRTKSW